NDGIKLGSKGGGDASTESGSTIQGNVVYNTAQDGISVYTSDVTVSDNDVYNSSSENGAIYVAYAVSEITITDNHVHDNTFTGSKHDGEVAGILIGDDVDADTVFVNDNSIYNNDPYGVTNRASDELDATNNWWGAVSGPSGDGSGSGDAVSENVDYDPWRTGISPGTLQAVIDAASPGDTIYLGPYEYEGGIVIDKPLTILGQEGTVVIVGSHGMTVSAHDVTIDGITFDGTGCASGSGDAGIYVQDGVERIVIRNCEVKNWCDGGIRFAGASTDVKIVDNYVHDNEKSGLSIDEAPAGTVDVYGNAFRNNGDDGIYLSSGSLTAEYNEWGDVGGPEGTDGDGVSDDVDYDPWVFGKLWVESASTTVRETEMITAYVKMDVHHLYGTSFALGFDTDLLQLAEKPTIGDFETDSDGADFGTNSLSDINDTGIITFRGYRASGDDEYNATDDVLLTLPFQAQEIAGISETVDLAFESGTKMGAKGGVNIFVDSTTDGEIMVLGTTTVDGVVDLQGRSDDSGAVVDPQSGENYNWDPDAVTTGSWGAYTFSEMTDDTYTFTVEMDRYLDASVEVEVSGDTQTLNTVVLLGGDANDDDEININDMTIIGGEYGNADGDIDDERADINADDVVDILDLVLAAGNYGETESPWSL
ncbi:MAG: right-handed parallel beta-helix repeat-containing protein, partial [Anaerolineales bacterium]